MDALRQPNAAGAHRLYLPAGTLPKLDGDAAGHVAAEAVHDGGPLLQGVDLIDPQCGDGVIQVHDVPPVGHLAGGSSLLIPQEELRVVVGQDGVRRGVVVDHVDDAFHAAGMDGLHQVEEILPRAVFRVDGPVVADGVGAAQRALAALYPDGVDGHEPQDVRAKSADAVQVTLQGVERTLRGVAADEHAVNDLMGQGLVCHESIPPYCKSAKNSSSVRTGMFRSRAFCSLLPAFSPATT